MRIEGTSWSSTVGASAAARTGSSRQAEPSQTTGANPYLALTSSDWALVSKMTGYNIVVDSSDATGTALHIANPHGSEEDMSAAMHMAFQIGADRQQGRLSGSVTGNYLKQLFARGVEFGRQLPPDWLQKGLDSLSSNGDDGPDGSSMNTVL